MKPSVSGGHSAYQDLVLDQLRKYYPSAADSLPASTWEIMERFWNLDLSQVDSLMHDRYSVFGPAPRTPSAMLRSVLLSVEFKIPSVTQWVSALRQNHLYAILSGFQVGDTPGIGTFYDFFRRLWDADKPNLRNPIHQPKKPPAKPGKKGEKAASVEKIRIERLLEILQESPPDESDPAKFLFTLFKDLFLHPSADQGLIDLKQLALSGDGTPVRTGARERKKRLCSCLDNGIHNCDCDRKYSQPDCDIGWDSHRNCYYFGYDLYMLTASDSESDLPVFPLLGPASRHDLHGFAYTFFSMKKCLPDVSVSKVILDSAHDAMPLYKYFKKESITPFIDLNWKAGAPVAYKSTFTVGKDGVPICRAGFKMHPNGKDPLHEYLFYRCPAKYKKSGCFCDHPCSDSFYGRVVKLSSKDNPRLFNIPPRDSVEWKAEYNARTSSERCNKREKIDYKLEDGRHRSSWMWYCRLYSIMMCQHLDAWALSKTSSLKDLFCKAA